MVIQQRLQYIRVVTIVGETKRGAQGISPMFSRQWPRVTAAALVMLTLALLAYISCFPVLGPFTCSICPPSTDLDTCFINRQDTLSI